jgi:transposase
MEQYSRHVGLDVHKASITVAVADGGGGRPELWGEIPNTEAAVRKLVRKLEKRGGTTAFCYEAGPCGFVIQRLIEGLEHDCMVAAPALIPQRPGDRIKNDHRDACSLARLFRAGELTGVYVPDTEHEAKRDLSRAREDMKRMEQQTRQRLCAFLLRHGRRYFAKTRWTKSYFQWLEDQSFSSPAQQIAFQEYVDAVKQAAMRVRSLEEEIRTALCSWRWEPVVTALMALRGVDLVSAFTLVAEIGDFTRFPSPCHLMNFLGMVPSEYSSGERRRRGHLTKTGNGHARRILVESSWHYRFQARKSAAIQRRAEKTTEAVQAIAWKAQKRLCGRFRHLVMVRNKPKQLAVAAVARELAGFVWAIACEVALRPPRGLARGETT